MQSASQNFRRALREACAASAVLMAAASLASCDAHANAADLNGEWKLVSTGGCEAATPALVIEGAHILRKVPGQAAEQRLEDARFATNEFRGHTIVRVVFDEEAGPGSDWGGWAFIRDGEFLIPVATSEDGVSFVEITSSEEKRALSMMRCG